MATNGRIERLKQQTKKSIFFAALRIIREQGWQGLSMRKIAQEIEYTAPAIYEYFASKEALAFELKKYGFQLLTKKLRLAAFPTRHPAEQIKSMWLVYWDFALIEIELYQLMFNLDVHCNEGYQDSEALDSIGQLFKKPIEQVMLAPNAEEIDLKFFTYWSFVHGLIAMQLTQKLKEWFNRKVLVDGIQGITASIYKEKNLIKYKR